jgi:carbon storage regulator
MLVLTRRPREVVLIGNDVQVLVLDVEGDRVRLGVTAPHALKILRQELQPFAAASPTNPASSSDRAP